MQDDHLPGERCYQPLCFQRLGAQFEDEGAHLGKTGVGQRQHVVDRLQRLFGVALYLQCLSCRVRPKPNTVENL